MAGFYNDISKLDGEFSPDILKPKDVVNLSK